MLTPMVTDDFQQKSDNFMSWLKQRPGASISSKIRVADKRRYGAGRGIEAVQDIDEDEELFSVGLSDVLSVENSDLPRHIPEAFTELDPWMSLILVMIYEDGQKEKSTWWPYFNIFPNDFDTLMQWSPSELAELQGSAVVKKIGKSEADASFLKQLLPIVKAQHALFGDYATLFASPNGEACFLMVAHRMATLIMAYAFDFEPEQDDEDWKDDTSETPSLPKAMVPLADLLNADGDKNNAHLLQEASRMTMIAIKPIKKGQEIFNDYGQLPRSDLLRTYGYITDNYKKWDVVEIGVETIMETAIARFPPGERQKEARIQLADNWQVYDDGYDLQHQPSGQAFQFEPALLLMVYIFTMDSKTLEKSHAAGEALEPPSPQFTLDTALVLKKIIIQRRDEYNTSIAEDTVLLQDSALQGRRRMAIEVRLGEKEILGSALEAVVEKMRFFSTEGMSPEAVNGVVDGARSKKRRM